MATGQKESIRSSLERILSAGQVVTNTVQLLTYERDASLERGMPDALVFPRSVGDVVKLAQWSREQHIPLIARGAGTGLAGGAVAEHGGVIVEFSHLKDILAFDPAGRSAQVQAGCVTNVLEGLVRSRGLYYPPDPSSGRVSTIGGNIGANSGGPHCFKYGVTANYVTAMDVVLADGRLVQLGGSALDYPGYDLASLIIGGEGTLGIVTSAALRLIPLPPAVKTMMAAFESIEVAGEAVSQIIAAGLIPATIEMMDQKIVQIVENYARPGLPVDAGAVMIVEIDGYAESMQPQMDEIAAILQPTAISLRVAQTPAERDAIWYGRKSAVGAIAQLAPAYYLVDGTVPRSKLAHTLHDINHICDSYNLRVGYVFHAGDGNLHPLLLIENPRDKALIQRIHAAGREIMQLCIDQGGSITGEHGVGMEKRSYMPLMYDAETLQAMQDIKAVFDPHHLMNPHKLFPADMPVPAPLPAPAAPPAAPCAPESAEQAAEALRAWAHAGKSIRICGSGSKAGGLPPADVQLDTSGLRGIRAYAPDDLYVVVGAGTPLQELQEHLAHNRMWVPWVSPWPQATIGGIIASNYNAPLRMRYGGIRDSVLAATVALPNGRVIRVGRAVVKNVAGYDLARLFVGSYGTLGLLTDITLKLMPQPRLRTSVAIPVEELDRGLALGGALLQRCIVASALVLCRGCETPTATAPYTLLYTGEGAARGDVLAELQQIRATLREHRQPGVAIEEPTGSTVWANLLAAPTPAGACVRIGVAPGVLPALLRDVLPLLGDAPFVADLANGLLHVRGVSQLAPVREVAHRYDGYAIACGGAVPAGEDAWGCEPQAIDLMRGIKARWDAHGLLNPGAFLV